MSEEQKAADDTLAQFISVVLNETEETWSKLIPNYQEPTLVLFRDQVQSGCGGASAASGPFYCPSDGKVYIDLAFYDDLRNRFGAPGDFAMAYVVAHEVGHHIQNLMGTSDKMQQMRQQVSEGQYNKLSVKLELQADFFAGVWAHHTQNKNILEAGDIEEAMNAANAIGDDRLQKQARGTINPESFTHGTSEQRMYWFKKGYTTGDIKQGNTFESDQ
jgi:predicted metalloprotease